MIKKTIFENAVRIKENLQYQFTSEEEYTINLIPLIKLVPMIYNYMSISLPSYSVENMVKMYIENSINIKVYETIIIKKYDNISICNLKPDKNLIMKAIKLKDWSWSKNYYDNVIYEKASKWFTYYDNHFVGIETNLVTNNKCRRVSISHPTKLKEFYVATLVHMKFCFEELGYEECYRLVPKLENSKNIYKNPYRQGKIKPVGIKYSSGKEELDNCIKIKYTPSSLKGTIQDFKEAYDL